MVKVATTGGFSPTAVAVFRWPILAVLLFLLLSVRQFREAVGAQWPAPMDAARAMGLGFCLFGPAHLLYYFALVRTSSVEGTVLGTTAPIWTAVLAWIVLRERISRRRVEAIALGFVGAWIVSVGFALPEMQRGNTFANLVYLAAVFAETISSVQSATLVRRSSGMTILAFQVLGAVPALLLAPLVFPTWFEFALHNVTPAAIGAVAYLVLVPGLVCFSVWFTLVERTPLSLMVLTLLIQPPLSAILGAVALEEPMTTQIGIGTVLILAGLVLAATERKLGTRLSGLHSGEVPANEEA